MSAINCCGDEVVYGAVLPGWYLFRFVNVLAEYKDGTVVMGEGDWGLTRSNDPDFSFSEMPLREPNSGDEEWTEEDREYTRVLEHYRERLVAPVEVGYELVEACIKAGWDKEEGGLAVFLMDRMVQQIEKGVEEIYKRV